jgi:hypothetical protein
MTSGRSKTDILGETAKGVIKDVYLWKNYGIRKEFWSKYTDKGNEMEDQAIQFAGEVLEWDFVVKNEENYSNDFITGTPDINTDTLLADIKCSWDGSTFPFFDTELKNKAYYWQMMGYMWLCDKEEAELVYCLMNTPHEIVLDEIRRAHWKANLVEDDDVLIQAVESQHHFDHIPNDKRVKRFIVKRDEQAIEQIKERVNFAREYYEELKTML